MSVVQGEEAPNEEENLPKIDEVVPEEVPVRRKQVEFHKETPEPEVHHQIFKRRVTRNNLAKDANAKDEEDILEDPLKLFQAVLNVEEVDQETKLDLFICKIL